MQNRRTSKRAKAHKKPVRRERPPTVEQVEALADAMRVVGDAQKQPNQYRNDRLGLMLRGFTLTAAWSGLRLFEVAALEWRDVVSSGRTARLHVRHGKGYAGKSKERTSVLLEPGLRALMECAPPGELVGQVFHNGQYRAFTRQRINVYWHAARKEAAMPHVWFHDLRKFCGTWLLDHGASDLDVAVQLGHFDSLGRPDPTLVRMTYGFPAHGLALKRIEGIDLTEGSNGSDSDGSGPLA